MSTVAVTGNVVALPARRQQVPLPSLPSLCDVPGGPMEACKTLADSAGGAAGSAIDQLVDILVNGFSNGLRFAMSWWTKLPSPELTGAGGAPGSALSAVRDYTSGLQVIMLTCGLMFAAARLAMAKRGGVAGEAQESFLMLARAVFGAMTFAAVVTAGTQSGDAFANWVLDDAAGPDRTGTVERILAFGEQTRVALGPGALLTIGLLGLISMLVQLVMLVVRQALLILVVAVLPIAAAASGTGPGSQSYKKLLAWTLAFVLWKPVGSLVYAVAFTVIGNDASQDPHMVLLGLILLVMSVVVLPALIRLVAPAVSTLGGGGGAASVLAGGLAGVAMGAAGGSKGGSGGGRKLSEGDNAAGGGGGGGAGGGGGGGLSGPAAGGGGRAMPASGSGGGGSGAVITAGSTGEAAGGGAAGAGGGAAKSTAAKAGAGSGGGEAATAGSAGAAGPVGAAVAAGEAVKAKVQQGAEALESAVDSGGAGAPDALGPGEVRR
ncbi:hypothetical protein IU451_29450 [Nocardia cyriacigeorgica]|uniref:hypothetical protein n=1 Tax=Nocardia cyriacigeorgica TaxID=135487 RepID=UPI0018959ED2|nr:hypothetical protein [Nocardia cyriacigeorgica]MBF6326628.1 hypothetical protein [Nocardia cyriacigeorgica]